MLKRVSSDHHAIGLGQCHSLLAWTVCFLNIHKNDLALKFTAFS